MADRNAESHFGSIETSNVERSMFPLFYRNIGTANAGRIIPFHVNADVLPGDTMKYETSAVVRMLTPMNPTMDDLFLDTYYFAVPHRLTWEHWKEFMGESKDSAWVTQTEYEVPMLEAPEGGVAKGTIADYMGIPKNVPGIKYQALPFRAMTLIYNTWFRNQNLIAPYTEYMDDTNRTGSNTDPVLGGLPFKAGRVPDYISTALPEAQKVLPGFDTAGVKIPLGSTAPVVGNGMTLGFTNGTTGYGTQFQIAGSDGTPKISLGTNVYGAAVGGTGSAGSAPANNTFVGITTDPEKSGIYADLTQATAATVNALRLAFQIQKLFELRGRAGSRYFEVIKSEFGTSPNLGYLQYPEYLGGQRTPLEIQQIIQNSATISDEQALGQTGGMSHTSFGNEDFTKSFLEHTIIIGVFVVRQYHFYDQALQKMWTRQKKLDYYTPILAHLGEQPILKHEIKCMGTESDNSVWGYQERWGEYKYGWQTATGEMNTAYAQSLDVWHYGDKYENQPTLSQEWFEETDEYINRTLAVTSTLSDQFKFDIVTNVEATRPMPVYCTPGLIDHF